MELLDRTTHQTRCPYKGDASYFTVTAGGLVRQNAVWSYENPTPREPHRRTHGLPSEQGRRDRGVQGLVE